MNGAHAQTEQRATAAPDKEKASGGGASPSRSALNAQLRQLDYARAAELLAPGENARARREAALGAAGPTGVSGEDQARIAAIGAAQGNPISGPRAAAKAPAADANDKAGDDASEPHLAVWDATKKRWVRVAAAVPGQRTFRYDPKTKRYHDVTKALADDAKRLGPTPTSSRAGGIDPTQKGLAKLSGTASEVVKDDTSDPDKQRRASVTGGVEGGKLVLRGQGAAHDSGEGAADKGTPNEGVKRERHVSGQVDYDPSTNQVNLGATGSSSRKVADPDGANHEENTSAGAKVGLGPSGPSASADVARESGSDADKQARGANVAVDATGATAGAHSGRTVDAGDAQVTTKRTASLKVGEETVVAGGVSKVKKAKDPKDLSETNAAATGSANLTRGEATAGATFKGVDKGGNSVDAAASATARTYRDVGKGLGGEASGSVGAQTASGRGGSLSAKLGGGYVMHRPAKVTVDGKACWQVLVKAESKVGLGASAKGQHTGASGSFEKASSRERTFNFATEAEAKAFYANNDPVALMRKPSDPGDLKVGETTSQEDTTTLSAGANASAGVVEVGMSVVDVEKHGVKVFRMSKRDAVVEISRQAIRGYGGSLGAGGSGVAWGTSRDRSSSYKARFDLKRHKKAFQDFVRSRGKVAPPKGSFEIIGTAQTMREVDYTKIKLAGLQAGKTEYLEESERREGGKKVEQTKGGQNVAAEAPLLGKVSRTNEMTITETDDTDRLYVSTTSIDDTHATDATKALGRATDAKLDVNVKGKSSGQWKITTLFSERQIDQMIAKLTSSRDKERHGDYEMHDKGPLKALISRLKAARGDRDAQRRAFGLFVKNGGSAALQIVRKYTGGKTEQHLELVGDATFPGLKGRVALERRLAAFRKDLAGKADFAGLVRRIRGTLRHEERRLRRMTDPKRYPDLPPSLRQSEVELCRGFIVELQNLYGEAKRGRTKQQRRERVLKRHAKKFQIFTPDNAPADVDHQPVECEVLDEDAVEKGVAEEKVKDEKAVTKPVTAFDRARARNKRVAAQLKAAKRAYNAAYVAYGEAWSHHSVARGKWELRGHYLGPQAFAAVGRGAMKTARREEHMGEAQLDRGMDQSVATYVELGSNALERAITKLRAGAGHYRDALAQLRAIERKWKHMLAWWEVRSRRPQAPFTEV